MGVITSYDRAALAEARAEHAERLAAHRGELLVAYREVLEQWLRYSGSYRGSFGPEEVRKKRRAEARREAAAATRHVLG